MVSLIKPQVLPGEDYAVHFYVNGNLYRSQTMTGENFVKDILSDNKFDEKYYSYEVDPDSNRIFIHCLKFHALPLRD
ncbi:hypothetical protein LCGC14_1115890 [marine sediment metagenome]|uniref:Uncharacterized protein n=1 Tax=marine sediment metagenome TaxID=412755 RepID=A0A0F9MA69_9ZZZZ